MYLGAHACIDGNGNVFHASVIGTVYVGTVNGNTSMLMIDHTCTPSITITLYKRTKITKIAHSVLEGMGLNTTRCQGPFGSVVLWQTGVSPGR